MIKLMKAKIYKYEKTNNIGTVVYVAVNNKLYWIYSNS